MGSPYSLDLRTRVLAAYDRGEGSIRELAVFFHLGPNTIENWLRARRERGSAEALPHAGGVEPRIPDSELGQLRALVDQHSSETSVELAERFAQARGIAVSRQTFDRAMARAGITRKKKSAARDGARHPARAA